MSLTANRMVMPLKSRSLSARWRTLSDRSTDSTSTVGHVPGLGELSCNETSCRALLSDEGVPVADSGVAIALIILASCASSGDRVAQGSESICGSPLRLPFPADVFDFGDKFGETDGDKILDVIAANSGAEKPRPEDMAAALAPAFTLTSESEGATQDTEWIMSFEAPDSGCRFSVQLNTGTVELGMRDFDRTWRLSFVERSPENQAFLVD